MTINQNDLNNDIVMIATGSGIAPFRGYLKLLLAQRNRLSEAFSGSVLLFMGAASHDYIPYKDELEQLAHDYPNKFEILYALSRSERTKEGKKMYIQGRLAERKKDVLGKLREGAHLYVCGHKGLWPGVVDVLREAVEEEGGGGNWEDLHKEIKKNKKLHVEVY
eukprot:GHVR01113250.1.p1 GENE.GHVR01113250.1~~GHVR01113250.1.p1  ORF type:complete len:164 (+),score=46.39 GHVR01113250.1:152-643(+)